MKTLQDKEISELQDKELKEILLTVDGQGRLIKGEVLKELLSRCEQNVLKDVSQILRG